MRGGKRTGAGRPPGAKDKAPRAPKGSKAPVPAVRADADARRRVALCASIKMPPADIAACLGITSEQLASDFSHELENGAAIVRAQLLADLSVAAGAGNASAAKMLFGLMEADDREGQSSARRSPDIAARALKILNGGKHD